MAKRRVTVDLDSIVVDLLNPWLRDYNAEYQDDLTIARCTTWNLHPHAKAGVAIYPIIDRAGYFANLLPLPGAVEGIQRLVAADSEVLVWTHTENAGAFGDKATWIQRELPRVDKYIVSNAKVPKHLIPTDFVIDDSPGTAKGFKEAQPHVKVVSIQYPYNVQDPNFDFLAQGYDDTAAAWQQMVDWILS